MDIHAKIMNIKADTRSVPKRGSRTFVYKMGHRDARHAAAELVIPHEISMDKFDFTITDSEPRILAYKIGGCRPASDQEIELWDCLIELMKIGE